MSARIAGSRAVKADFASYLDEAQGSKIVVTRHGRPAALLVGIEGLDMEQVLLGADPKFWKMIRQRRRELATITMEEVESDLEKRASGSSRR